MLLFSRARKFHLLRNCSAALIRPDVRCTQVNAISVRMQSALAALHWFLTILQTAAELERLYCLTPGHWMRL